MREKMNYGVKRKRKKRMEKENRIRTGKKKGDVE